MWKYILLCVRCVGSILAQSTEYNRVVNITQGEVRGYLRPEGGVYAFYNIPYASVPTGTDRFKAPLAPPTWMDTFNAVDRGIVCPQHTPFFNTQEDCLVANVFIPATNATNLPVAVHIHGGGMQVGHGNGYKPYTFVRSSNIIVVTFNYRLGIHGFLCLGTEGAPGNAGLKDQVALLRWVKTNIASFGGNPEDVTLIGCSAGAAAVDMLTLSSITNGLFKKAIVDSGIAFGGLGVQKNPVAKAQLYARLLNFNNVDDIEALEEFYKNASFQDLYLHFSVISGNPDGNMLFSPCLERDVGEERVLEDSPINIIRQGSYNKIPLMYGFTDKEGWLRIANFESWKQMMNENFADFVPGELDFDNEEDKDKVAATIKQFYFGDEPVSEANILSFIDFLTDSIFAFPMLKALTARIESQDDVIYLHEYSFVDENTPNIPHTDVKGADHCAQNRAVFDENESNITPEYRQMKANMREYWRNFIYSGTPSVEGSTLPIWLPATAHRTPFMSLGRTIALNSTVLLEERAALWDEIYEQFYRGPVPPNSAGIFEKSNIMITCILTILYLTSW